MKADDVEELELSLNDSLNLEPGLDTQVSTPSSGQDEDSRPKHILHNVEEWKNRKEAKDKAEAIEKIKQFKVR